jgi:Holliday junction resolvase RusA-like endonuclease
MSKGMKFPVVIQDNSERQKPWASIALTAQQKGCSIIDGPVEIRLRFVMPRLKSHFRTVKGAPGPVKPNAPLYHTSKPDLDKLIRCVKDALTSVAWKDDSQVADVTAIKCYGERPGVFISITAIQSGAI